MSLKPRSNDYALVLHMNNPINIKKRKRARQYLVQALYQWHLNNMSPPDIELQFQEDMDMGRIDRAYFSKLLNKVINEVDVLDEKIIPELDRDISELNPVELAILRMSTYELLHEEDIPFKVIINEALELTKLFGAEEGFKYVNAVLDALAKKVRPSESDGE